MSTLIALLLLAALTLFIVELLLPSGGLLGLAAGGCVVFVIVLLFREGTTAGFIGLAAACVAVPAALLIGVRLAPRTPVGRLLTLQTQMPSAAPAPTSQPAERNLIGQKGRTLTHCRPVGHCDIDGNRVECLAVGGPIERGVRIEVIEVAGMEIRIQPLDTATEHIAG